MKDRFGDFRDDVFRLGDGQDKVMSLAEAVARHVKPGMVLHMSDRANALGAELIRQFHDTRPEFTLVAVLVTEQLANLVATRLVRKLITSNCCEAHPTPAPNRVVSKAIRERSLEIENWTLLTLVQRFMAGALDLPFMPTKSMLGTSIAAESPHTFRDIADPFGSENRVGLVKALTPDISMLHGWAADHEGNIITAPYLLTGEAAWGAKASRGGVVATVERLVSTDFVREHASLITIPGYMVKSVSEAPLGAHPLGMATAFGLSQLEPYEADYDFITQRRQASRNTDDLAAWLQEWVLDCPDQDAYLDKLGPSRISYLKERAQPSSWATNAALDTVSESTEYGPREMMVVAAARSLERIVSTNRYQGILFGIGLSCLAGYLAYYALQQKGHNVELWLGGAGFYGFSPRPANSSYPPYGDGPTMLTSKMISDVLNVYGVFIGGQQGNSVSVLSAAEVDKHGNINSTKTSPDSYLIGSGGSNDAANAKEVLLMLPQSRQRLVDSVYYVTCRGDRVRTLVTDMGVFEKRGGQLVLTSYFADPAIASPEEAIDRIRQNCGWELRTAAEVIETPTPSVEELMLIRTFDPGGHFTGGR